MSRLIYYYNVGIYYEDIKTDKNFIDILNYIHEEVRWDNKVRKLNNHKVASAFPFHYQDDDIIVPMGQFRQDYQPKIGSIDDSNLKEIRELEKDADIVELSTFIYDENDMLLILEHNPSGLKKNDLEDYFSSFFTDGKYTVKLEMLELDNDINHILNTDQMRLLEIHFDIDSMNDNMISDDIPERERDCILDIFTPVKTGSEFLSSQVGGLVLKANYNNSSSMDINNLKILIRALNRDHKAFESINIRYRDPRTDKLNTVDLKKSELEFKLRILQDSQIENPGPEFMGISIIESKLDNTGIIYQNLKNFMKDMDKKNEYNLNLKYEIPEEYIINRE